MAGTPPKPTPPTIAAGSSSPNPTPPTSAAGSSSPKPPPTIVDEHPSFGKLVEEHLRKRVDSSTEGGADFIHEADVYSDDPSQLARKYPPLTARYGEEAWYFFTTLRRKNPTSDLVERVVANDASGKKGRWTRVRTPRDVFSVDRQQLIGKCKSYIFKGKDDGKHSGSEWHMVELCLEPGQEGGQRAGSWGQLVLNKVYRNRNAEVDDGSTMAVAPTRTKADDKTSAASVVVAPGSKEADEEIGADTTAGPGGKRKAGDKDSGAETVASSPARQKKADGESADAATTREIVNDSKAPLDAVEEAEPEEPRHPREPTLLNLFR